MPAQPWVKWFYGDWMGDPKVGRCSPETRGIWMDALCTMMGLGTYKIEGTDEQLARDCRATTDQIREAHEELKNHNVADVHIAANGYKTWVCRRLLRGREIKEIRRKASLIRWRGRAVNVQPTIRDPDANMQTHMQKAMQTLASGTLESDPGPEGGTGGNQIPNLPENIGSARVLQKWGVWMNVRRGGKKVKNWSHLFCEQVEWLSQFSEPKVYEILSASIRNGWTGLFEPKETYGKSTGKTDRPNPRNAGIIRGPTNYATAKPRLQREREEREAAERAAKAKVAGQVVKPENHPSSTPET